MDEKTRDVYLFIREYMVEHQGHSPSLREIDAFMRPGRVFSSTHVRAVLDELVELGLVERDPVRARAVVLVGSVFLPPALPEGVQPA